MSVSASETLALWERVGALPPLRRALALAAHDGTDGHALDDLPVGEAHARLLALRERTLGPRLEATTTCPECDARLELVLDARTLLDLHDGARSGSPAVLPASVAACRPPTWTDLESVAAVDDPTGDLLRRCVTLAEDVDAADLPLEAVAAIEEAMMAADPLAEVLVSSRCPDCGLELDASVDLAEFVWAELDARAARLLHEVDVLARAYGWTEPDVLRLSEQRRAAYLRLVLEGRP